MHAIYGDELQSCGPAQVVLRLEGGGLELDLRAPSGGTYPSIAPLIGIRHSPNIPFCFQLSPLAPLHLHVPGDLGVRCGQLL